MLQAIVSWSLRNRVAVVVLAGLLLVAGFAATRRAHLDVFPEFAPPQVVIQTEAPGLAPEQVEQLVTQPIENAVNGIPRLDVLRSQSIQGLSVVTVIFQDSADIYRARQQVTERLAEIASQFPAGVRPPRLAPLTSTTGRLLTMGFTAKSPTATDYLAAFPTAPGEGLGTLPWAGLERNTHKYKSWPDALELRDVAQWSVRPRLLAVPGVAQVAILGGDVRQYQVRLDLAKLAAWNLTVNDALAATREATGVRGAGFLENGNQRLTLRVDAQVYSPAELGRTPLANVQGSPVYLQDVAQVVEGAEPKFGDATVNGDGPAVLLQVYKQFDADTQGVTRALENEMKRVEPSLQARGIEYHPGLFRQANFIEHAVGNVTQSLLIGAALVCVVLFVFLFNFRIAIISLTAIPLSLLSAVLVLWAFGVSLNTLTLGGLAIAVGEVVDDAIIDVENIHRRLLENARLAQPKPALDVVLAASLEVRSAVVYATFIVVLVFVPVFFLSGLQGRLFAPLGYAYVLAVLASLVTALTVSPALALMLLAKRATGPARAAGAHDVPFLLRLAQNVYERVLRVLDRDCLLVGFVTVLLIAAAGVMLTTFGGSFLPELREDHFVVHMRGLPGTSLEHSLRAGGHVSTEMLDVRGVRSVNQQVGRAELGEDTWGVDYSEFEVDLNPSGAEDVEATEKALRQKLGNVAGFSFEVLPFLSERIKETLSGTSAAVVVKVYGDDSDAIDQAARQISVTLGKVPGSADVRRDVQTGAPEMVVRVREADAARLGLRRAQILDAVHTAYQGAEVAQVYKGNRVIDLVVVLDPAARNQPDRIANLWLAVPPADAPTPPSEADAPRPAAGAKGRVQLWQVADVFLSDGRYLVTHEGGLRMQTASCNVKDRDVTSFVAEAEAAVQKLRLPSGTRFVFTGEHEARQTAGRELLWLSLAAGAAVVLLLWMAFGSVRRLLLILFNVPFALVGGVAAVYLMGGNLDVGSLIGFVTLFGITMRNGIMMVSHWQHLHEVEGVAWGPELIFRGARERLAPVLMTALVTSLGLLPIALGTGEAGREIEGPMAVVILGGLVTSTGLNLFVLPVLYRRLGG